MSEQRRVRLFRNGRNQAIRIPVDFELPGDEAVMYRDGDRLVIEPTRMSKQHRAGRLVAMAARCDARHCSARAIVLVLHMRKPRLGLETRQAIRRQGRNPRQM